MVSWKLIGWRSAGAAALFALAACGQPIATAPGADSSSEDDGGERGDSGGESTSRDSGGESGEGGGESGESGD